jgi:hypothetical protein
MSTLTSPNLIDTREVAKRIKKWVDDRGFETKALESNGAYIVKARKASGLRAVIGADRALEISVRHADGATHVDVRQGSWKTNAVSNAVWLVATGGANLLISGWSIVVQKDLEGYVKSVFEELSETREIQL